MFAARTANRIKAALGVIGYLADASRDANLVIEGLIVTQSAQTERMEWAVKVSAVLIVLEPCNAATIRMALVATAVSVDSRVQNVSL